MKNWTTRVNAPHGLRALGLTGAALLLAAFRHKAQTTRMAWKWGSFIDDFYRTSGDRTLWGLMLAVAHGVSKAHPAKQMEMLLAMRHVVKAELRRLKEAKSGA